MSLIYRHGRPTIGVLAGWQFYRTATNLSYLLPVFQGIYRAAQDLGCNVLLGCGMGASASPEDPARPAWPYPSPDVDFVPIGAENTDGILIFTPLHSPVRSQQVQSLIASGHPVLFIGSGEPGPTLAADNHGGVFEAIRHLVQHGHKRIAFIAGSPDDLAGDTGERLKAYQTALGSFGLELDQRRIAYGRHVYDGGYSAIQQILGSGVEFTAVLVSNDEMALGAMQALKESGREIPQDVAVIGFDNRSEGAAHKPSLSSVHVPLFNMGHQAVVHLLRSIQEEEKLPEIVRIDTRLVARESCGCGTRKILQGRGVNTQESQPPDRVRKRVQWIETISAMVMNQAQKMEEKECLSFCRRLVDSFMISIEHHDPTEFLRSLDEILMKTMTEGDDAHIWEDAVSFIGMEFNIVYDINPPSETWVDEVMDQARLAISAHMQEQYRQYVSNQRWISSRLSLLTARLLTALDELQVYSILAQHLPVMDISLAQIVLFEAADSDPLAWSTIRNALDPAQEVIRFRSFEFPPVPLLSNDQPSHLALIPLVDQTGQLGYMVFGIEYFDLYGAIVQQLGGALNTARLYRQATEGRRLAEEANRMKSRFLSTISHELRTPLNLIVGLSGMVLRDNDESSSPLAEPTRKDVERIHTYSQHLGGLIGDVIDLATSDAGQLRLNNEYIDLGQALRMVAESGSQLAADKGLEWETNLPETGPWVWGDRTRLRQIALNLINNAIKFTAAGRVRLQLLDSGDSVTVKVSDTGLGISPEEQQVIFDEFRQSERSVSKGYGGLGLGLAISKRLVEIHRGSIAVHSTGEEGAGSTFSFTLPTIQPPLEKPRLAERMPTEKQSLALLTNRPGSCEKLHEELHQRGFRVKILLISRGLDWRIQLDELFPDTIILDVSTDSALGWDVLKEIKASQPLAQIPVLFFSSSQPDGSLIELDYLTKPIELSELTRALDQHWLLTDTTRPTRTILVVDDEPDTLEMHARIVQAHSPANRVLKARNGKEALEILHHEIVDLVLLDLQMPEMDGFVVLEVMRGMESTRKIPVIVLTGKDLTASDMRRLNQGVAAVLGKGLFSINETITHISTALENRRRLSGEAQRLVRSGMAYIHENYMDEISRRDIAKYIGITEDHLTFCFRQELGTTPIEYLQRYRINQAKRLLKESQDTITEIAMKVGFSDSGYFSRIFRRGTGMPPDTFRRS
jgi:signal transduction histidine kinase/DNA-binding LacI/PurR family transcriptional regulator/CheY-like chemotaxis protein